MFHRLEPTSSLHSSLKLPKCFRIRLELQSSLDPSVEPPSSLRRNQEPRFPSLATWSGRDSSVQVWRHSAPYVSV